jgi:hypothetical protein
VPRDQLAADTVALGRLFSDHDYDVESLTTDALLDPKLLSPDELQLLVMPALGVYPHEGLPTLAQYLKSGGALLSLGGLPFDRPLAKVNGRWQFIGIPESPPGQVNVIADFEQGLPAGIATMGGAAGERLTWEMVPNGEGKCLRAATADLQQYEYVTFDVRNTGDESFSVLHFRARADEGTSLMGLEMNETDGSRWKMVLPLSTTWREYTLYIPHSLSYATEDRGGPGDYLHPERLTRLAIGFITKMVGVGPHTLYLDDIQRWRFVSPAPDAITPSRATMHATAYYYGDPIKLPPDAASPLTLFRTAESFENASLRGTGRADICPADTTIDAPHAGWLISPVTDDGPALRGVAMARRRIARVVPLLTARAADGADLGPAVFAVLHHGGPLAGASWACFGLETSEILADQHLAQAVLGAADYLTRRPRLLHLSRTFGVGEGGAEMTLTATAAAPKSSRANAKVVTRAESLGGAELTTGSHATGIAPGDTTQAVHVIDEGVFDPFHYRVSAELTGAHGRIDREVVTVDATGLMRRLCDFFVEAQRVDGAISGSGYIDQRAARGLLAMYEMTGDHKYRDAAIRWGEKELREQREDGGYRMGYGISDAGESCYVADGGEIAIGIARLVGYVPTARRPAYIDSLRRYFEYRESFRLPDGGIAVGWVFDPRYTQRGEGPRLPKPVRSDKYSTFVIGCTLASAAALHHITGRPSDRDMALRDAQRFLDDDIKARSVFGEAAQWAHYFLDDGTPRAALAERMKDSLLPFVAEPDGWWYAFAGRSAVTLGALQYYYTQIDRDPAVLAGIMRGVHHMVADDSPSGLIRVLEQRPADHAEWRYLCYASISLAEILQPLVTMRDISPP